MTRSDVTCIHIPNLEPDGPTQDDVLVRPERLERGTSASYEIRIECSILIGITRYERG